METLTGKKWYDVSCPSWAGSHKVGYAQQYPLSNGSDIYIYIHIHPHTYMIEPKQAQKAQESYMKKWTKCSWSPLLLHYLLSLSASLTSERVSYNQLTEEENTGILFTNDSAQYAGITWKWMVAALSPLMGHPWMTVVKGNLTSDQNFKQYRCCSLGIEGEMARSMVIMIHGLWPLDWLDAHRPGRNMTWKLVIKKLGKEVCG